MSAFRYALVAALAAAILLLSAVPALAGDGPRSATIKSAAALSSTSAYPNDPGEPRP